MQVKRTLEARFPDMDVVGSIHPPGQMKEGIAQLCSLIFMVGLVILLTGEFLGNALNVQALRDLAIYMKANTMQTVMFILMANFIGSQMLATGAFEVYHEEDLIFSKLQTGGLPQLEQIVHMISSSIANK